MNVHTDTTITAVRQTGNLVDTINEYWTGLRQSEQLPSPATQEEEERQIEATFGPAMEELCRWDHPLESLGEVRAAIQLAFDEDAIDDDMVAFPLKAALKYLDQRIADEGRAQS